MQADYSTVMPFIVKALLDNRRRYAETPDHPKARGYLRPAAGYRLYEQREELCRRLKDDVRANREWLLQSMKYA